MSFHKSRDGSSGLMNHLDDDDDDDDKKEEEEDKHEKNDDCASSCIPMSFSSKSTKRFPNMEKKRDSYAKFPA